MKMIKITQTFLLIVFLMILSGCAQFHRLEPQYVLPPQSINYETQAGKTKIVFFNNSNVLLYGIDMTDKIDITIDDKNVGSVRLAEYLVIDLFSGEYKMNLTHYDTTKFSNNYTLKVIGREMYIEIYNGPLSTNYKIVDKLPDNFQERYKNSY